MLLPVTYLCHLSALPGGRGLVEDRDGYSHLVVSFMPRDEADIPAVQGQGQEREENNLVSGWFVEARSECGVF